MAITAQFLKKIMSEARPIIERQMNDAKLIAGFRTVVANNGGDWGALKALIKAHVEDENDEAGDGKRVQKVVNKADDTAAYADMLGLANVNEKNFSEASQSYAEAKGGKPDRMDGFVSIPFNAETGEITEQEQPAEPATTTPASQPKEVTGGNLSIPSTDAGGEDRAASADHHNAQSEQAAQSNSNSSDDLLPVETDSPASTSSPEQGTPFEPLAFLMKDKPDCLKLNDGHCKIGFATPALCSARNQARMARAGA